MLSLLDICPTSRHSASCLRADLLLLIPSYGAGSELFVPAKLYEYLACRKPILCLAEPGDSADLVLKARAGSVVPPTDRAKIVEQLVSLYHQWEHAGIKIDPDMGFISSFERRKLTGQLAGILDDLSGKTV